MSNSMRKTITVLFLFAMAVCVLAATNGVPVPPVPGSGTVSQGWLALIPAVVPLVVALLKAVTDKLPTWTLPIIASALGELLNYISGLAGGPSTTVLNGVILGAAGTGTREVLDQLKTKFVKPPVSVNPS